jgi:hypothetical protein
MSSLQEIVSASSGSLSYQGEEEGEKGTNFFTFEMRIYLVFKEIVSRNFEVCFLIPLDSSDIASF